MSNGLSTKSQEDKSILALKKRIATFIHREGRRPRILIGNLGQNEHDRLAKRLASSLAEYGLDVDISPPHQTPQQTAKMAIENDAHIVHVSVTDAAQITSVAQLADALKAENNEAIYLVASVTLPPSNYANLNRAGVALIMNMTLNDVDMVNRLLDLLE
jgi:methylmalonyl-CoA mutase